jgi:hypothetical protein
MADNPFSYESVMGSEARNVPQGPAPTSPVRIAEAPGADNPFSYENVMKEKAPEPKAPAEPSTPLGPAVAQEFEGEQAPKPVQPTSPHAQRGWFDTLTSSIHRGAGELALLPKTIGAVGQEALGDEEGAAQSMREVQASQRALPQAQWSFENIHDLGDFGYWLTERFGEATPSLIAMLATGGVGGLSATLATRSMANLAARAAVIHAGELGGTFALAAPMGVGAIAGEQFSTTGSTQPTLSTTFGIAGGALQTYLPFKILASFKGDPFAKNIGGAIAKGAAIGGGAGTGQEALNIVARKYTDPDYSFFADGPDRIGWGERLLEAGVTNTLLGAAMGPIGHRKEKQPEKSPFRPEDTGDKPPGTREELSPTEGEPPPPPAGGGGEPPIDYSGAVDITEPPSGGKPLPKFARGEVQPGEVDPLAEQHGQEITEHAQRTTLDQKIMRLGGPRAMFERSPAREAPPEATGATTPDPGPISQLRRNVIQKPITPDRSLFEATQPHPENDAFGVTPLLRDTVDPSIDHDGVFDWIEANTPRYAVEDPSYESGYLPRLFTDTDWEKQSTKAPQSEKPKLWEIDQNSLQPVAITADVFDLPPAGHERIWFLPGTTPEERVLLHAEYSKLAEAVETVRARALHSDEVELMARRGAPHPVTGEMMPGLEQHYEQLTNAGLRVVPSRGSSFYYNGTFTGRRAEPLTTGRSKQIAILNPENGAMLSLMGNFMHEAQAEITDSYFGSHGMVPVSVDLNKFAPGEIAGALGKGGDVRIDEKLTKAQGDALLEQWNNTETSLNQTYLNGGDVTPHINKLQDLMKKGISVAPTKDSIFLITKEPLQLDKLTPGVLREPASGSRSIDRDSEFGHSSIVYTDIYDPAKDSPDFKPLQRIVNSIGKEIAKQLPVVDQILDALGIKSKEDQPARIGVEIHFEDPTYAGNPGSAIIDQGVVRFYARGIANSIGKDYSAGNLRNSLYTILMHEVGHLITYRMISQAPPEIQTMLRYAYNKHLLDHRLDLRRAALRSGTPQEPGRPMVNPQYYRTYPEWLAEQFRRWSLSNEEPKTMLERQYKSVAKSLEGFFRAWEEKVGKFEAKDLLEPDYHFSAAMHFWRAYGDRGNTMSQLHASQAIHRLGVDVKGNPASDELLKAGPLEALRSMYHMFPENVQVEISRWLNPAYGPASPGAVGRTVGPIPGMFNFPLIELAVGAMPRVDDVKFSRKFFAHELVHVHRMMGTMHDTEFRLLHDEAQKLKIDLHPQEKADLARRVREQAAAEKWSPEEAADVLKRMTEEERVAQYIESFANGEIAPQPRSRGIMERILDIMTRIANTFRRMGYNTREDVLRRFFDGEMAARQDRMIERSSTPEMNGPIPEFVPDAFQPVKNHPELTAIYHKDEYTTVEDRHTFVFYEGVIRSAKHVNRDRAIGWVKLKDTLKGPDVEFIKTQGDKMFMMKIMMDHVEQALQMQAKPSGQMTDAGYKMAKLRYREEMKHYVYDPRSGMWYSPNYIREMFNADLQYDPEGRGSIWRELYNKIPKETWKNPILNQMFMLPREWMRDEVQGSIGQAGRNSDQTSLQASVGAESPASSPDSFTAAMDQTQQESRASAARRLGVPYSQAAPRLPTMEMRNIIERMEGYRESPEVSRKLNRILDEKDRIGWFTKKWWDILQLMWHNEHIEGLRDYVGGIKLWQKEVSFWQTRADETVRAWAQLPEDRRAAMSRVIFHLAEMEYRTGNEKAAGTVRQPTALERTQILLKEKFKPEEEQILQRIEGDYKVFLQKAESLALEKAARTISDPARLTLTQAKIRSEFAPFRAKPYFPMTRFGRWTIAVRDVTDPKQPVIASHAYDTRAQRDAALDSVRAKYPGQRITYGTVAENAGEFMGLPGPLLRRIKDELPGLTKGQLDWIEEFEQLHMPDNTFRRKWLPQNGLPGYSMDALRAHSSFFMSGANYLARLAHSFELEEGIAKVRRSLVEDPLANTGKRQEILTYMQDHYRYISEAGRDWGKTKAFISLWQLGASPAAAFTNLLQTPTTTFPHLMGEFGNVAGTRAFMRALDPKDKPPGQFDLGRSLMREEGLIDVGQAAELAAYAEGHNLLKTLAGSKSQLLWREISHKGMWMFQKAEEFNRIITAKAAWRAAMENPNNKRVIDIQQLYPKEMGDLQTKGLNQTEASAYLYAKEVLEKTQFTFAKWNRPPFLRSQLAQVALIFFKYTQNMIELYRLSPGVVQMGLIQAALFGLAGLPGAEDLNQVMRSGAHAGIWLLRKLGINLYGQDFDLLDKVREYTRNLTEGTVFDQVGPDLMLHGISRYGFGTGLLPEGFGVGQFDASQNGSLGRVVPGLQEGLKQLTFGDYRTGVSDVASRAAGAGYGWMFTLLKYMNEDPGTFDSKTWEGLLPRVARQGARTYRFATEGLTTKQGGRLVKFDLTDPEDLGALLGQAMGYTPTKVGQMQEASNAIREQLQLYQAERVTLYGQMDKAVASGSQGAINDVRKAIDDFNRQVREQDPSMVISGDKIIASIRKRNTARAMQEALGQSGQVNRSTIPVAQRIMKNYPEIVSRQKVQ